MDRVFGHLRARRWPILAGADAAIWLASLLVYGALRYSIADSVTPWGALITLGLWAALLHTLLALPVKLHQGRRALASFEDLIQLGALSAVTGVLVCCTDLALGRPVAISVPLAATFTALVAMACYRGFYRVAWERMLSGRAPQENRNRALIIGAGLAGTQLVQALYTDRSRTWEPVGFIDDAPHLKNRRVRGVPVLGTTADLVAISRKAHADLVILAMPSATSDYIRAVSTLTGDAGLQLKVLPRAQDLVNEGRVSVDDVRDLDIADLLGRHQVETDIDAIAGYLTGKRVLVTGAGGSIGSELCRQISRFAPEELMMLDRDESALHAVQLSIHGRALLDDDEVILCDIRDRGALRAVFEARRPEIVFHAAALKHLPMLEQYPAEAVKSNVWGTLNVLEASELVGVERFVNISTDKAANPSSVLGYSKRLAEGLTAAIAARTAGTYLSVRFGNVLGSRGSVLTAFNSQISEGGPVTVTDPDVTRYFMTVQEAVQLVIQAAAIGEDGEALILDMGKPVSIDTVARRLIEQSGRNIRVKYTGLRPGEKLHEELFGDGEPDLRRVHPLISHSPVPQFDPAEAHTLQSGEMRARVREDLAARCALLHQDLLSVRPHHENVGASS